VVTQEEFKQRYDQQSFNAVFNPEEYPVNREPVLELQNDLKHADALAAEINQLKSELVNAKSELLALRAQCTKKAVQQLVVENENKQLKATIVHLENKHGFRNSITNP
jgi:chromosome segregation ATPase